MIRHVAPTAIFILGLSYAGAALANGLFENRPWQFETPSERIANIGTVDLIEKKKGGFYDSFDINTTINNENTTIIEGDQINCTNASTATGNANSGEAGATVSSPTGVADNQILAEAIGSNSDLTQTTGEFSDDANQLVELGQSNTDSDQSASNTSSDIFSEIGTQNVDGQNEQILNSDQNIADNVQIASSIEGSTACLNTLE